MLFSENKLRELASLSNKITTEEILTAINSIGFEVESSKKLTDIKGIKFGHVLETYKNQKSDKLNVCEIEFSDKKRIIQTTANNVKKGDYIIAFVPGSSVNGVVFQAKEMQGVVSEGMLASFEELGFNAKNMRKEWKDGIFIFDKIDLKKDPIKELKLDDNIIDVSILTNRSDASSYLVMALELSAYFQTKPLILEKQKASIKSSIKMINFQDNFITGIEANVKNWKIDLQDIILLLKSNIELENDLLDLSSLVFIMTGVSSRIYNLDKIPHDIFLTKESKFKFDDLLLKDLLVLRDKENVLGVAGILERSEFKYHVGNEKALIEFGSFDTKEVRDSSRALKVTNISSINTSKCISFGSIIFALKFISNKLTKFSNAINEIVPAPKKIKFEESYINKYAGFEITKTSKYKECLKSLKILGFEIKDSFITIPLYRHDIENMQDIVEEVFRFYGLNNFKASQPKNHFNGVSNFKDFVAICSNMNYYQLWTYTLMNKEKNEFNPFSFKNKISLLTYVSEEHNSVRNSLALSLDEIYSYNNKRKMNGFNFFDIGMINNKKALCLGSDIKTYAQIKEDIFKIYGKELTVKKLNLPFIHPNYNAGLFENDLQVGWIGKIHPKMNKNNLIFAEILIDQISVPNNSFVDYENIPLKERDITIPLKQNESIDKFMTKLKKLPGIYEIKQISTFEKENVRNITFKIKMNNEGLLEFDKEFNI